ncbi:MAG TPA: 3-dehydroquinate synthase [Vicinamibacterales bacterium]|nr:3-dehydroquinate synthase [Vicinamibacterales bacterium]
MDLIRQKVRVDFEYPVYFSTGVLAPSNLLLRDVIARTADQTPSRLVVIVDQGVADHHPALAAQVIEYCQRHRTVLHLAAPVMVVPGGEGVKNDPRTVDEIHRVINDAGLCRHSYVVAIGGGAVLDAAGYAAATAHRGIRLIRVPTTVLAQDDSAMGVKNCINAFGKKNYLGTFAPPFAVINDSSFLTTLSDRDWRAGVSEAIKAALIKDRAFFDYLEQQATALKQRDLAAMEQVIKRCAALHLSHIATGGDPFELGSSRPLDFGHWSAHKLEQLTGHRLGHGEAVAIGIALDATYSYLAGYLPEDDWRRILNLLPALGLTVYAPELGEHLDRDDDPASVLRGLDEFREHLGGTLTILMLRSIGAPFDVHEIRRDVMIRSIGVLRDFERAQRTHQEHEVLHERHLPAEPEGTGR